MVDMSRRFFTPRLHFSLDADSEGRVATRWTDGWPCALFSRPNFHRQCRGQVPILHGSNLASDGQSGNLSEGDKRDSKGDHSHGRYTTKPSQLGSTTLPSCPSGLFATLLRSQHLGLGPGGSRFDFLFVVFCFLLFALNSSRSTTVHAPISTGLRGLPIRVEATTDCVRVQNYLGS